MKQIIPLPPKDQIIKTKTIVYGYNPENNYISLDVWHKSNEDPSITEVKHFKFTVFTPEKITSMMHVGKGRSLDSSTRNQIMKMSHEMNVTNIDRARRREIKCNMGFLKHEKGAIAYDNVAVLCWDKSRKNKKPYLLLLWPDGEMVIDKFKKKNNIFLQGAD